MLAQGVTTSKNDCTTVPFAVPLQSKNNLDNPENITTKLKKRKVAILFGYIGGAYHGLQRHGGPIVDASEDNRTKPFINTIEDEIVKALLLVKAIPVEHAVVMKKMSFQRAARTDKGVSAVANMISLKLWMLDKLKEKLNNILPSDIHVFDIVRVCQGFDSKKACDSRSYSYLLPAYCLIDVTSRGGVVTEKSQLCPSDNVYDRESMKRARHILNLYLGVHNFHNFTSRRRFTDPSCMRNIISVELTDPFMISTPICVDDEHQTMTEERQYCLVNIKGQSFMLNQIRKMVSVMAHAARGLLPTHLISEKLFESERLSIIRAPAEGLYLHRLHYDCYNSRYASDGSHQSLSFDNIEGELQEFRDNVVLPDIIHRCYSKKTGGNVFIDWLAYSIAHPIDEAEPRRDTIWFTGIGRAHAMAYKNYSVNENDDIAEKECDGEMNDS